jgi:hypothetical protein
MRNTGGYFCIDKILVVRFLTQLAYQIFDESEFEQKRGCNS